MAGGEAPTRPSTRILVGLALRSGDEKTAEIDSPPPSTRSPGRTRSRPRYQSGPSAKSPAGRQDGLGPRGRGAAPGVHGLHQPRDRRATSSATRPSLATCTTSSPSWTCRTARGDRIAYGAASSEAPARTTHIGARDADDVYRLAVRPTSVHSVVGDRPEAAHRPRPSPSWKVRHGPNRHHAVVGAGWAGLVPPSRSPNRDRVPRDADILPQGPSPSGVQESTSTCLSRRIDRELLPGVTAEMAAAGAHLIDSSLWRMHMGAASESR